jgi:hypothetical protein
VYCKSKGARRRESQSGGQRVRNERAIRERMYFVLDNCSSTCIYILVWMWLCGETDKVILRKDITMCGQ